MRTPRRAPISVLLTGFGPFPGAPFNPSAELVRRLLRRPRPARNGVRIAAHVFQTRYAAIERDLPALIARHEPDVVLMCGLAARTRHLRIETRARNLISFFPDAGRVTPPRRVISRGEADRPVCGPLCIRLLQAARSSGMPARLSRDAGRYVCNYALWHALEPSSGQNAERIAAFVHIPSPRGRRPRTARRMRRQTMERLVRAVDDMLATAIAVWRNRNIGRADRQD